MERKDYQKPVMRVFNLRHKQMLMQSGVKAARSGYGIEQVQTWDEEE
jgi:hypothetical protein